jgi:hypothetical protein
MLSLYLREEREKSGQVALPERLGMLPVLSFLEKAFPDEIEFRSFCADTTTAWGATRRLRRPYGRSREYGRRSTPPTD